MKVIEQLVNYLTSVDALSCADVEKLHVEGFIVTSWIVEEKFHEMLRACIDKGIPSVEDVSTYAKKHHQKPLVDKLYETALAGEEAIREENYFPDDQLSDIREYLDILERIREECRM